MMKITVSVIVAVRNGAPTLQRCIDSFAGQTYPPKELIIIDGGSTDGTVEILKYNSEKIRYWVSEPDRGIYSAWNKALKVAQGDWVYFLGADDYFMDEHVLAQVALHLKNGSSSARVVYGRVDLVRKDGSVIATFGSPWDRKRFFQLMTLPHQGVFHHRSLFQEHGGFNEEFRIAGDYDLLRELRYGVAEFVPRLVAALQHSGMSSNPVSKVKTVGVIMRARRINASKSTVGLRLARERAMDLCPVASRGG
jgi:glycosyltransferase involved in cell wall biosynthesis